jgi:hypothetical protein
MQRGPDYAAATGQRGVDLRDAEGNGRPGMSRALPLEAGDPCA